VLKAGIGSPAAASRRISSILDIGVPAYILPRAGLKLKRRIGEKIRVGREAARLRVIEEGISFDAMNTAISDPALLSEIQALGLDQSVATG
jgi:hypothetical protein